MKIYLYDKETKAYLGKQKADSNPEETRLRGEFVPLVPANATLIPPPEYNENEIPIFDDGKWKVVPDYRSNFFKIDKNLQVFPITNIGLLDGFYLVKKELGEKIKASPELYKIVGNEIVLKTEKEIQDQLKSERQKNFESDFFKTSLGWIRRNVTMKNGKEKDFLSDILLSIKAGLELGQEVIVITYQQPDFSVDIDEEYLKNLQKYAVATPDFIKECLMQNVKDFSYEKEV